MYNFKKSTSIVGTFKEMIVNNGEFIDGETGEVLDLPSILEQIYGEKSFTVTTKEKDSSEINAEGDDISD